MGPYQVLHLRARVDLGAMAMKGYSAFPKVPALLKPHHRIVSYHLQDIHWGSITPLQRYNRCILQPQLTGPRDCMLMEALRILTFKQDVFAVQVSVKNDTVTGLGHKSLNLL